MLAFTRILCTAIGPTARTPTLSCQPAKYGSLLALRVYMRPQRNLFTALAQVHSVLIWTLGRIREGMVMQKLGLELADDWVPPKVQERSFRDPCGEATHECDPIRVRSVRQ
jgi:hypothetical protein